MPYNSLQLEKKNQIKNDVLQFVKKGVNNFLNEKKDLVFYAFALDYNADHMSIGISFNTDDAFTKTLHSYQTANSYQTEESIHELKYEPGDWDYICVDYYEIKANLWTFSPDWEDEDFERQANNLMEIFCEVLVEFEKTEEFISIPKVDGFKVMCIDHDEDVEIANKRLDSVRQKNNFITEI